MKTLTKIIPLAVSLFFIILFIYAAASKMLDFENFQVQLAQSPLLSAYAGFVSYGVIILELVIVGLLCFHASRLLGLYASFAIMVAFTVYIFLILNYSDFVPCSCGGILEKLGWEEHLIFNIVCVLVAGLAVITDYPITPKASVRYVTEEEWMANYWQRRNDQRWLVYKMVMLLALPAGLMVALFFSSEHIIKKENNFTRRFLPHPIDYPKVIDLKVNSYYFAGHSGDTIFLGNKTAPLLVGKILPEYQKLEIDTLQIHEKNLPFREAVLQVLFPHYSFSDGNVPAIFEGKFPNMTPNLVMKNNAYFSKMVTVGPHLHIFRGQSTKTKENIMGLLNTANALKLSFNTEFLEKQVDGVFDTDGNFVVDPYNRKTIYTYHYRNEYRILDSTLTFAGKGKTIDTISRAQIKLVQLKDQKIKMSAPPLKVNENQAAYREFLFNEANLRGKFETYQMWNNNKIVDVYHYPSNTYQYSFTVPHDEENKMRSMLVTAKHFYILRGDELIRYQRMR